MVANSEERLQWLVCADHEAVCPSLFMWESQAWGGVLKLTWSESPWLLFKKRSKPVRKYGEGWRSNVQGGLKCWGGWREAEASSCSSSNKVVTHEEEASKAQLVLVSLWRGWSGMSEHFNLTRRLGERGRDHEQAVRRVQGMGWSEEAMILSLCVYTHLY